VSAFLCILIFPYNHSFFSSHFKPAHLSPMHNHHHHHNIECSSCSVQECPARGAENPAECLENLPYRGMKLSLISAWFFLSPIVFGICGALWMNETQTQQLLGGLGGLLLAIVLNPLIARFFPTQPESQE
jgi:hypothetical protein